MVVVFFLCMVPLAFGHIQHDAISNLEHEMAKMQREMDRMEANHQRELAEVHDKLAQLQDTVDKKCSEGSKQHFLSSFNCSNK